MSTSQPLSLPKFLVEYELSQECKDLISSLPKENGWLTTHNYQYQGFWLAPIMLQAMLACQKHFQAQDTDILLITNPKSGTTWLKALLFTLVNRIRYRDTKIQHPLLTNNPHDLVPFLEFDLHFDKQVPDLTSFTSPRLFCTHLPLVLLPKSVKDSACKLVYLCRNPRDTFVSLWHFTNNFRAQKMSLEEAFDMFCQGINVCGPLWDHVLGYWKESLEKPEKVLFLKYEEMKEQPTLHLRRLAEFLGCPFSPEEETEGVVDEIVRLCSFENLSNLEVNTSGNLSTGRQNKVFFRRGEVGDWKNYLTPEMAERLDQIIEQKLCGSGLKF
ncbi:cytosolic sulfotransferase 13-like [Cornus florida]|uniref:cytosolic sulfotransferase 13-like n=1 Tax=Cornus florida TaxID=4283 RepID=UPI00289A8816|nr:cytosolic sulfotransferase 13-like [Cornus florida]